MSNLKNKLIRLGKTNPDLREHIRPVLKIVDSSTYKVGNRRDDVTRKGYKLLDAFGEIGSTLSVAIIEAEGREKNELNDLYDELTDIRKTVDKFLSKI